MAHLSLSVLGPFQATLDGQLVTGFDSAKVRALLAYLAVEADRPHSREALAGLLWPDYPDRSALNNLRSALANLRQAISDRQAEPPFLLIARDTIQFNTASDYDLDLEGLEDLRGLEIDQLEQVVSAHRGSFLEGFSCDSAPFEEWALVKREQTGQQMVAALHRLAAHYEKCGEYEHALTYARKQLELEPWDEQAHRQLMRALALNGQRGAALAQFEICRRTLMQELSVAPSPETTALYASIRDGSFELTGEATGRKGISDAPSFLAEEQTVELPRAVFVARERELAQLNRFLDAALAGQGHAVFVTGEPGSGKTALIQEFTRQAIVRHRDLIVAQGNGNAHVGVGDPYLPFIETLQMLTGDVQARWAGGAITRAHALRLWHLLPDAVQALVDVGPELVDRFLPGAVLAARGRAYASLHLERRERSAGAVWQARLDALLARKAAAPPDPTGV
jgi:DNA-binding SARP family transcriptional activator